MTDINFVQVKSDINGNPRYVCHFLNFITPKDKDTTNQYELALNRAHKLGGRKFNNKQYGGGIVFQSYNLDELNRRISNLIGE